MEGSRVKDDEVFLALIGDEKASAFLSQIDERILSGFAPLEKGTVLQFGCTTLSLTEGLLDLIGGSGRIVVVDPRLPLLDAVRFRTGRGHQGKVFFKSNLDWKRIPFDDEVFRSVVSALFWDQSPNRLRTLSDLHRVLLPGGDVALATHSQGSFAEFYDLYAETLTKFDLLHLTQSLQAARGAHPGADEARDLLVECGFTRPSFEDVETRLEFRNSKEIFESPLVKALFMPLWTSIGADESEHVLWHVRQAWDRYFSGRPLRLTARTAILRGYR